MATQPQPALAQRLIEVAIEHFGAAGYEGASTREIASASGTAMSSITYHFGGKQGLYLACADYIAGQLTSVHGAALARLRDDPPQTPAAARALLIVMIENFGRRMLSPESAPWAQFIVREQQQPTEAFERLYENGMCHVLAAALQLMTVACPAMDDVRRRTVLMNAVGMALALRLARATTMRVMRVDDIDEATAEILIDGLRKSATELLTEKTQP